MCQNIIVDISQISQVSQVGVQAIIVMSDHLTVTPRLVEAAEQLAALRTGQLLQLGPQLPQLAGGQQDGGESAGLQTRVRSHDCVSSSYHGASKFQVFLQDQQLGETPVDVLAG